MHWVFKTQKNETALPPEDTNVQLLYFWPHTPNPTSCSLHSQTRKQDAFILVWMTRKDLWLHPCLSTENKVFQSTLSCHLCILFVYFLCILEHQNLCSHPLWNWWAIVDSEQIRQMRYSHHSDLSGFSVLFLYHRQHWGSSYAPTGYFHMQHSKMI